MQVQTHRQKFVFLAILIQNEEINNLLPILKLSALTGVLWVTQTFSSLVWHCWRLLWSP